MPEVIQKLAELFMKLPGVGPRQARRFVHAILSRDQAFSDELIKRIQELNSKVRQCDECYRYFPHQGKHTICSMCKDPNRDTTKLIVVEKDADLDSIRRVEEMNGRYFVLGGLVPLTDRESPYIRMRELLNLIKDLAKDDLEEVILAISANPQGDHTVDILKERIENILSINDLRVSTLGRGLSTGTELEYSDIETLKEATMNRH